MNGHMKRQSVLTMGFVGVGLFLAACSTAPKEATEIYTKRKQADALIVQGNTRMDSLVYAEAAKAYDAALKIYASLDYRPGSIRALLAMGRQQTVVGNNSRAFELYFHAQRLAEQSGDNRLLRDVLNHQGDLAIRTGDPVKALSLLDDTVTVPEGREAAAQLRLRASAEQSLGRSETAISLLQRAVGIAELADEPVEAAQSYYKLASIASLSADFEKALHYAFLALEKDKLAEYTPGIAADLRALAIINSKAGNDEQAEDYYRRSWLAWRALGREDEAESSRIQLEVLSSRPVGEL